MMKLIRYSIYLLLFSSCLQGEPHEPTKAEIPSSLAGEVAGDQLILIILPDSATPVERKLKGTRFINIEPGCIVMEAYVTLISEKQLEVRMPHDDAMTLRAMKHMGVSSRRLVVTFEPSNAANKAGTIVAIYSNENKPSEQAGTGQPATRPQSKSEGSDKSQPEAEGRSR